MMAIIVAAVIMMMMIIIIFDGVSINQLVFDAGTSLKSTYQTYHKRRNRTVGQTKRWLMIVSFNGSSTETRA